MKFDELAIGDWFYDKQGLVYVNNCIFIKIDEKTALSLNYDYGLDTNWKECKAEVEFVSSFVCDYGYFEHQPPSYRNPFNFCSYHDVSRFIDTIDDIPIYAIYRFGNVCYKKIGKEKAVVIYDPYNNLMGMIVTYTKKELENKSCPILYYTAKFDFPEYSP